MRFGNFLFPESRTPEIDGLVIDETLTEARLCDELGMDAVWLAEHHFDGNCAYVDPLTFAAALASITKRTSIGFAVVQTSLYHPIRLAEQLSLLDHLSKGRLIVGLGRGSIFNIYEYEGYGIGNDEAQARFEEAEQIIIKAWNQESFDHDGIFWKIKVPMLRPRPYTRPHPEILRAASSESSVVHYGRQGRPFLMNAQTNETTRHRIDLYRKSMRETAHREEQIAANLAKTWVWRSVYVAGNQEDAEATGRPAFTKMQEYRSKMRERIAAERGAILAPNLVLSMDGFICGSPEKVTEELAELADMGVGGVIMQFRLGAMPHDVAMRSIELFMAKVAPELRQKAQGRA